MEVKIDGGGGLERRFWVERQPAGETGSTRGEERRKGFDAARGKTSVSKFVFLVPVFLVIAGVYMGLWMN